MKKNYEDILLFGCTCDTLTKEAFVFASSLKYHCELTKKYIDTGRPYNGAYYYTNKFHAETKALSLNAVGNKIKEVES